MRNNAGMSQKEWVLNYLRNHGDLTPLEALGQFGIYRLAARVWELKNDGYNIECEVKHDHNGKAYASYRLIEEATNGTNEYAGAA